MWASFLEGVESMSLELFTRAKQCIPGGVHSPVRSFANVGGVPRYWISAKGAYLVDSEHRMVLDYVCGFGPQLLGHGHEAVVSAVQKQAEKGMLYGGCHPNELTFSELLTKLMPGLKKTRLMNSGTEAVMTALRLARHITKKRLILRFQGHYHGHVDDLLEQAGSGVATHQVVTTSNDSVAVIFNSLEAVDEALSAYPNQFAAVIVEAVAGNMGCILPKEGFLQGLQQRCKEHGILLIVDEVMTGFRVAAGGAQERYALTPDITVLGKIIGGGLPIGAIGGSEEVMDHLAPLGPVYQGGTFSSNPLTLAAGLAALTYIDTHKNSLYSQLEQRTQRLCDGLERMGAECSIPITTHRAGGMLGVFFSKEKPWDYQGVLASDLGWYKRFFHAMLMQGVLLPPSPFEAWFVSSAHSASDVEFTLEAARNAFASALNDSSTMECDVSQ